MHKLILFAGLLACSASFKGDTDTGTVDTGEPAIPGNYSGEMSLAITLNLPTGDVTASCNPDVVTLITEALEIDGGFYNCALDFSDVGVVEASGYINGSIEATALQASGQLRPRAAEQSIGDWEWTGALADNVLTGSATGTSSVDLGDAIIDLTYSADFSAAQ